MAGPGGRVIEETPKQAAARQRQGAAANGTATPQQQELDARRAAKRTEADKARDRFLEESGFAAVLERAEVLVADLPRGLEEHRRAQAACAELTTFLELAREAPEDHTLGRFARRADDLLRSIQAEPLLVSNANALRGLIARVRSCNVDDVNGPVRNPNVTEAWRKQFMALLTGLPGQDYAAWCAKQVAALIAEARAARRGASWPRSRSSRRRPHVGSGRSRSSRPRRRTLRNPRRSSRRPTVRCPSSRAAWAGGICTPAMAAPSFSWPSPAGRTCPTSAGRNISDATAGRR